MSKNIKGLLSKVDRLINEYKREGETKMNNKDREYKNEKRTFEQDKKIQPTINIGYSWRIIENINYYNKTTSSAVEPLNFRRNIITEGIELNKLINKEFSIGNIKVKAHDLCRPCKYLQELLNQKNFVKELLLKAGLRCEILTTGKISIGDIIKTYD